MSVAGYDPSGLPRLHVALIGELGVGKTSLIERIKSNTFTPRNSYAPTIGEYVDVVRRIPMKDASQRMAVRLHDTSGLEREGACLTSNFYRNKDGFILTWDITREETYRRLATWEENAKNHYPEHCMPPFIVIANKAENHFDSDSNAYQTCLEHYAKKRTSCFKTSAQEGINVDQAFHELLSLMGKAYVENKDVKTQTVNVEMMASSSGHHAKETACCTS